MSKSTRHRLGKVAAGDKGENRYGSTKWKAFRGVIAGTLVFSIFAVSPSIGAAPRGGGLLGGLLGGTVATVDEVLTNTIDTVDQTLMGTTQALGFNLGGDEFGSQNTGRISTRDEIGDAIRVGYAHDRGYLGEGIGVAVIDTGIAPVNSLADDYVIDGPDLSLDFQADAMESGLDGYGHGTHLAGIIASRDGGIAPRSTLVNMKVGAADGAVDVSQVIAAIDWAVTHRNDEGLNIRVINLAYGTDSSQYYVDSPLAHAVESAWRNGIVVVASAGNSGDDLVAPATDPFVITVGAIDSNSPTNYYDDELADYSAVGDRTRGVDILAPGTSIASDRVPGSFVDEAYPNSRKGELTVGSGTSQAAAVVSGAVANLLSQRPDLSPDQVKKILVSSARYQYFVKSHAQGGGVLDMKAAIRTWTPRDREQGFTKSTGLGSLDEARGTGRLQAEDGTLLEGEVDIVGQPWDGATWAPKSTAGSAWDEGFWNGSELAGNQWTTGETDFESRRWRSEQWESRRWRSDNWESRRWRSDNWESRRWRSDGWE